MKTHHILIKMKTLRNTAKAVFKSKLSGKSLAVSQKIKWKYPMTEQFQS